MKRKIDIGEDKNYMPKDLRAYERPQASFLNDDLARSADDALNDARKVAWVNWINSEPLLIGHTDDDGKSYLFFISDTIKNRVALLEIWDYTLLPCRREMNYIVEWQHRYAAAGLLIVGIHAPMFEFGKDKKNIMTACRDLGITFPVVMDNNFDIWKSLENRFWPRRILIDAQGRTQMDTSGEGNYTEYEKTIQVLLREISPGLACPPVMKPLSAIDKPDYKFPTITSEIFFGAKYKPRFGNAQYFSNVGEETVFKDESAGVYAPDLPYLASTWVQTQESLVGIGFKSKEANTVTIKFRGSDVYLVAGAKPKSTMDIPQSVKMTATLDKKPIPEEKLGHDCHLNEYRRSALLVRDAKLFHIATKLDQNEHELKLMIDPEGTDTAELYALFFEHRP
jgi:hypothetical protein